MPPKFPPVRTVAANLVLIMLAIAFVIGVLEISFRLVDFDFEHQEESFKTVPIFFRQPNVPVGEVFFRRPGPDIWTGQVLASGLRVAGGVDDVYRDEPQVTIEYDKLGFRNPDNLTDWDVVVVGDSFVELGFLPYEDLFTTQVGVLAHVRVKNLGVSFSGPLTYDFLLKEYGRAEHARHSMMVFYEGNDIVDLLREKEDLDKFRITGLRTYRTIIRQTSFIQAVYRKVLTGNNATSQPRQIFQNSFFVSNSGEFPLTVSATPPGKSDLAVEQRDALGEALADWARISRGYEMTPWLVYIPSKRRVFEGHLRLAPNALRDLINRAPSNLPDYVRELSEQNGIRFIDPTPALVAETEKGNLTYNPIWDAHLNRPGAHIVAQFIATALNNYPNEPK